MRSAHLRDGFTVLELLIVLVIIAILAGMVIAAISVVGRDTKQKKCRAILATLEGGLSAFAMDKTLKSFTAVPHPALALSDNQAVTCADTRWPLVYGWPTQRTSLFGVQQAGLLPLLAAGTKSSFRVTDINGDGSIDAADGQGSADGDKYLKYVFGKSGTYDDLVKMGALRPTKDTTGAVLATGNLIGNTTYAPSGTDPDVGDDVWKPDQPALLKLTPTGKWKTYTLPGLNLYDPWNREIFYYVSATTGRFAFVSAGPDGALAIDPGLNQVIDTTVNGAVALPSPMTYTGDDRDGTRDNIRAGGTD